MKIIMNRGKNVFMIDKGDGVNINDEDKKVYVYNTSNYLSEEFLNVAVKWGYWESGSGIDKKSEDVILKMVEKLVVENKSQN